MDICSFLEENLFKKLSNIELFLQSFFFNDKDYVDRTKDIIIKYICDIYNEDEILDIVNYLNTKNNAQKIGDLIKLFLYIHSNFEKSFFQKNNILNDKNKKEDTNVVNRKNNISDYFFKYFSKKSKDNKDNMEDLFF